MSEVSQTAEVIIAQKMSQSNGLFNWLMRIIVLSTEVINVQTVERKVIAILTIWKVYLHAWVVNIQPYMMMIFYSCCRQNKFSTSLLIIYWVSWPHDKLPKLGVVLSAADSFCKYSTSTMGLGHSQGRPKVNQWLVLKAKGGALFLLMESQTSLTQPHTSPKLDLAP